MTYAKQIILLFILFTGLTVHSQIISTVAGNGTYGFSGDGGQALYAQLYGPAGMAVDDSGNLYIADVVNNRIRKVDRSGVITTFAGSGDTAINGAFGGDGGPATSARLNFPASVAIDHHGNILIADASNNRIRRVNPAGIITTIAGSDSAGFSGDGGPATAARLNYASGVAVDRYNNIYIADNDNDRIRKIDVNGIITTIAGNGYQSSAFSGGYSGDGGPATDAAMYWPQSIALDTSGNVIVADMMNNRIRKIGNDGIITTIAGSGALGYGGDNGPATAAAMVNPSGITFDSQGNLYIADGGTNRVRMVTSDGIITTIAGNGVGGFSGDGGMATDAELFSPTSITLDRAGNIYISDASNYRIRVIAAPLTSGASPNKATTAMSLYPNPSSSSFILHITAANNTTVRISITNATGQTIKELQAPANKDMKVMLDVPVGIYTVSAHTDGGTITRKIVIAP